MAYIRDAKALQSWFKNQGRAAAAIIAARAALRVLPVIGDVSKTPGEDRGSESVEIILPVLRAMALAWTNRRNKHLSQAIMYAANTATHAASGATHEAKVRKSVIAASVADAAATAVAEAFDAGVRRASDAVQQHIEKLISQATFPSADHDAGVFEAGRQIAGFWRAVSRDATLIEEGKTPDRIASVRLWHDDTPDWVVDSWERLKSHLRALGDDWEIWITWYQARLGGRPTYPNASAELNEKIEIARVLISSEIWEQGSATVDTEIRRLEHEILGGEDQATWNESEWDQSRLADFPQSVPPAAAESDFFLSYATEDAIYANKIAIILGGAGYKVFLSFTGTHPGDNIVNRIEDRLKASGRLIAVLSPNYLGSEFSRSELTSIYQRDRTSRNRTIIPFLIAPCDVGALGGQICLHIPGRADRRASQAQNPRSDQPAPP